MEMGVAAMAEVRQDASGSDWFGVGAGGDLKVHLWAPGFTEFGGGIAAFSREVARGLVELGHDVRLFGKIDRTGTWKGLRLSGTGVFGGSLQTANFITTALSAIVTDRPDHVISTHVNFGPAAHVAKNFLRVPYTLVAHGIDVHPGLPRTSLAALREANRIIAVSVWTRDRVLDLGGIDPENVVILPNTVDETVFSVGQKSEDLIRHYRLQPGEKVVLTVARLDDTERYKGYDRIIEALPAIQRRCGAVRFIIVGTGEDRARIAQLAKQKGVESMVSFAGFVSTESLVDHYRLADVFAMPSTGEGFGIVFLEAMGCGTPVVAGNRDGSIDALDGGWLGLTIEPMYVDGIADAISSILEGRGPGLWFDRKLLHEASMARFGQKAFVRWLKASLPF
jgi:glycosyltransferase involved in cell wall biosynthesis